MPDFDEMLNEVEEKIQERDAEDDVVNRAPELRKLSENIDKATNTWINATLQLEATINRYERAESRLANTANTIGSKVDTINYHIGKILEEGPNIFQVSVNIADADLEKIQSMFNKQQQWVIDQMQKNIQTVNAMLIEERKKAMNRYKEYDGCYLGHYAQWFFWFFFVLGFFIFTSAIVMMVSRWCNWF